MLKSLFLIAVLALLSIQTTKAQVVTLTEGIYNNVLLDTGTYTRATDCQGIPDVYIGVDPVLLPLATGMTVVAVITNVNAAQPNSFTTTTGPIAVGDTLPFDTTGSYPVYMTSAGSFSLEWRAVGIPTVSVEPHFCEFITLLTASACNNGFQLSTMNSVPQCSVEAPLGIHLPGLDAWDLYPVPASGPMKLVSRAGNIQWTQADLFDIQGRKLRSWTEGEEMSVEGLDAGVYFLKFEAQGQESVKRLSVE